MQSVRHELEAVLLERLKKALAALPDGGAEATPERAELVRRAAAEFVRDANAIADRDFSGRLAS